MTSSFHCPHPAYSSMNILICLLMAIKSLSPEHSALNFASNKCLDNLTIYIARLTQNT